MINNIKYCSCQFGGPIELVCIDRKSKKKLFCRRCALYDPYKNSIKSFQELEALITKNCDVQRIQNVLSYSDLYKALDQVTEITKKELCNAVEKRCLLIKATLAMQFNPLKRIAEAMNNVSNKQYNTDTVEFLVQELDCNNFTAKLNQLEATSYQQNKLVCEEIISYFLMQMEQTVSELGKISNFIQQKLDFKQKEENKYQFPTCKFTQNQKNINNTKAYNILPHYLTQNYQQNRQFEQQIEQPNQSKQRVKTSIYNITIDEDISHAQPKASENKSNHLKTSASLQLNNFTVYTNRQQKNVKEINCSPNYDDNKQFSLFRHYPSQSLHQSQKK